MTENDKKTQPLPAGMRVVMTAHGGHSHGGHSHGGHSHGGHSHGASHPGHGVAVEDGFVAAPRPDERRKQILRNGAGRGRLLFLDMPSGIAGDMTIAALLDLGAPVEVVEDAVAALGLNGVQLQVQTGYAGAIGCTHVDVLFPEQSGERGYQEIVELITAAALDDDVKVLALRIFERLAHSEAQVHQTTLDHVHFHEVGAVDAIVDIVGSAALFCYLGARVVASPVPLGRGFVKCRHGTLPLPAPATLGCLEGVPTIASGLNVELVTPTGAAIVATVAEAFGDWFAMSPEHIGWGAGTRGLPDRPNALRAVLGRAMGGETELSHVLLEANIDDMSGEIAGYAITRVLENGALDAWVAPITMKKGRPGMVFSALCSRADAGRVTDAILRETSTIGVRQSLVSRVELERSVVHVDTRFGSVRVKVSQGRGMPTKMKPEWEDCAAIAEREGLSLREVLDEVSAQLRR